MELGLPSGRKIGPGHPPFIIAEIGSNWKTPDDCLMSIRAARACGADAVKFQLYHDNALYGFKLQTPVDGSLDPTWLPELKAQADKVRIEFMCSAFSPELIEAVNPYVSIHKVASAECTHKRMLEKLRALGKPVFLSTGGHGEGDIAMALEALGNTPKLLMYCISAYPALTTNLRSIRLLGDRFECPTGFSDHSWDAGALAEAALSHGACVFEKHVNFTDHKDTPDAPHSLRERHFKRYVLHIMGCMKGELCYLPEELEMIQKHNRRLIATQDIKPGERFVEGENFGIYRSLITDTHALSPFMIDEVAGREAKREIRAGFGIGPGDF